MLCFGKVIYRGCADLNQFVKLTDLIISTTLTDYIGLNQKKLRSQQDRFDWQVRD